MMNFDENKVKLDAGWKKVLLPEFNKPYMNELRQFLKKEIKSKKQLAFIRFSRRGFFIRSPDEGRKDSADNE